MGFSSDVVTFSSDGGKAETSVGESAGDSNGVSGMWSEDAVRLRDGTDNVVSMDSGEFGVLGDEGAEDSMSKLIGHTGSEPRCRR